MAKIRLSGDMQTGDAGERISYVAGPKGHILLSATTTVSRAIGVVSPLLTKLRQVAARLRE